MNASLVLFLLFLSTCEGNERDTSPPSSILLTTGKAETPLEASCPDATDIEPCDCINDLGDLTMDCSNVRDEEQLRKVFSAFFPTTEFYRFMMLANKGVKKMEDGVFGNVNFQSLYIESSGVETVKTSALIPSLSTLTDIWISYGWLEIFPLERLRDFTSLQYLDLSFNKILTLPPLSSSSLRNVRLSGNLFTHITPDVFKFLPAVEEISLDYNHLTEIPKGTFTGLPRLKYVSISSNNISYVQSLTFDLVLSPYHSTALFLFHNNIEYVEVDAFKGVAANTSISISYNTLTRLPEEVWRPVLEKSITVNFEVNDLACGCDVAWLVRDFQLLTMANHARCADGTLLVDLNPADFGTCG